MTLRLAPLLVVAALVTAVPARAAVPAASCTGVTAKTDTFATAGVGGVYWLENMGFDGRGGMWVSELALNQVVRYDASGKPGLAVDVTNPGATVLGSDGRMFAAFGDGPAASGAGVMKYDPASAHPSAVPFADGLKMANGAAFDAAGNLYVADTVNGLVAKIGPDGKADADWLAAPGADGVARIGDTLYVTEFSDPQSTILAVPVADPGQAKPLAQLSESAADALFLDDLDVGPDGRLYVASNKGEVVRVDPRDGSACVVVSGLAMTDSVRFARDFAPYDAHDAFLTSQTGTITHLRITEPTATTTPAMTRRPKIRLRARPRHARVGQRVRLHVVSPSPCRRGVRIRGRHRRSIRFRHPGRHVLVARKPGCRPGRAVVRVQARPDRSA